MNEATFDVIEDRIVITVPADLDYAKALDTICSWVEMDIETCTGESAVQTFKRLGMDEAAARREFGGRVTKRLLVAAHIINVIWDGLDEHYGDE